MGTSKFPSGKSGHFYVSIFLQSGSHKILELSGSVQMCNGIALPLTFFQSVFNFCHKTKERQLNSSHI